MPAPGGPAAQSRWSQLVLRGGGWSIPDRKLAHVGGSAAGADCCQRIAGPWVMVEASEPMERRWCICGSGRQDGPSILTQGGSGQAEWAAAGAPVLLGGCLGFTLVLTCPSWRGTPCRDECVLVMALPVLLHAASTLAASCQGGGGGGG